MQSIYRIEKNLWPESISQSPHPPEKLYARGDFLFDRKEGHTYICIIGSRKYSSYGKDVCQYIIGCLRGLPVTIVSGLALGIDSIAHTSAIENNLRTIAFPGSGLSDQVLYPRQNIALAKAIVENGGGLISEFEPDFVSTTWAFPKRNRLMAALCEIVIVIEATKESGSLITARLALDYNKTVCAIPGSIFSKKSEGTHYLLQQGAIALTDMKDIHELLGIKEERQLGVQTSLFSDLTKDQLHIIDMLSSPISKADLIGQLQWPTYKVQIILMELEIKGIIKESLGQIRLVK